MRKHLGPVPLRLLSLFLLAAIIAAPTYAGGNDAVVIERMKKDITYLASEECEGRGVDTEGINRAADYIVAQIKQAGVKPGGKDGSYFQPFTITRGLPKIDGASNTLTLTGPSGQSVDLTFDSDFKTLPVSSTGKASAPIVFVGYGVTVPADAKETSPGKSDAKKNGFNNELVSIAPAQQKKGGKKNDTPPAAAEQGAVTWVGYDDFKGVDVKGKIVVVLRRVPRYENAETPFGGNKDTYSGFEKKIANCMKQGAVAVLFVNDNSEVAGGDKFMAAQQGVKNAEIPVVQLRRGVLDMMLISGLNTTLTNLEKDIDRDLKPRSAVITGWSGKLSTAIKSNVYPVKNIIGVLEGSGPLADETIVIGAHYDHLGMGGLAGGMGKAGGAAKRYPGADDNGSGSTAMIELARRFGEKKNRQGRRLVIMWFTGEELGLLGSKHYAQEPLFPLEKTAAMVNLDMVGRLNDKAEVTAEGFDTGKGMQDVLDKLNEEFKFSFVPPMQNGKYTPIYTRSDQSSFYNKKIPAMFFFSGFHPDYHKQTDFADRINVAGMAKITTMAEKLISHLLTVEQRPQFQNYTGGKAPAKKAADKKDADKKDTDKKDTDKKDAGAKKDDKKGGLQGQSAERQTPEFDRVNIGALVPGSTPRPSEYRIQMPDRVVSAGHRYPPMNINGAGGLAKR